MNTNVGIIYIAYFVLFKCHILRGPMIRQSGGVVLIPNNIYVLFPADRVRNFGSKSFNVL